jgi:anthranilate synthase component 1
LDLLNLHARFPQRYPVLFESAARAGAQGRHDILFAHCGQALWKDAGGRLLWSGHSGHEGGGQSFLDALDDWWRALRIAAPAAGGAGRSGSFSGGWAVFLGYEMAAEAEPSLQLPSSPEPVVAFALRTPAALLYDRIEGRLECIAEPGFESLAGQMAADLRAVQAAGEAEQVGPAMPVLAVDEEDPDRFLAAVRQARAHIAAGNIYQANLSRLWRACAAPGVKPTDLYRRLRAANPAPFAALCDWQGMAILSSSPERLCAVQGGRINTRPIAGTRPRSHRPGADHDETSGLIAHPKERAEHVMLIDLERNDLGRICRPGSVQVDEFMVTESYEHVHHIVSSVSGTLLEDITPGRVLRAVFPGGTITGCPKVRCMRIIAELEGAGRGAYTGALGYLNRDGSCDFNILIRTMVMHGGEVTFRAGAGIVADSSPRRELEETRAKAEGLLRALRASP